MSASKLGGSALKCQACQKTVYPLEAVSLPDATFHKRCFKCAKCDCVVSPASCAMYKQIPYCKVHFLEMFKERGTYAVFNEDYDENAPAFKSRSGLQSQNSAASKPDSLSDVGSLSAPPSSNNNRSAGVDEAGGSPASLSPPVESLASRLKKFNTTGDVPAKVDAPKSTEVTATPELEEPGATDQVSSDGISFPIFNAIMQNDVDGLRVAVRQAGLSCMFDKDESGATPIELSFRNDKLECGRMLLDIVHENLIKLRSA